MLLKFFYKRQRYVTKTLEINRGKYQVLVADSFLKRMIGLMYRKRLDKSCGMLFVFGREGVYSIWMYNMQFSIDVIWADRSGKIVDIEEELKPCGSFMNCRSYTPAYKAKYVIEFNARFVAKNRLKKGDAVRFQS